MVDIREATLADIAGIRRVARAGWHGTYDDIVGPGAVDAVVDEWYDPSVVREGIERADVVYLVADDGGVVGYAAGGPASDAPGATLSAIYVHPDRQRDGIGSRLLETLTDRLAAAGFERLRITVLTDNDAGRSFYEEHGFEPVERGTADLAGESVDEVVYAGPL